MPTILEKVAASLGVGMATAAHVPAVIFRNSRRFTSNLDMLWLRLCIRALVKIQWNDLASLYCASWLSSFLRQGEAMPSVQHTRKARQRSNRCRGAACGGDLSPTLSPRV